MKVPHAANLSHVQRLATRISRVSPPWLRRATTAVTATLVLAAGLASFAVLVQRWDTRGGAPSAVQVDPARLIDFRGQDAQSWTEYWLTVGQVAGVD